jgi:hypothetical protein
MLRKNINGCQPELVEGDSTKLGFDKLNLTAKTVE